MVVVAGPVLTGGRRAGGGGDGSKRLMLYGGGGGGSGAGHGGVEGKMYSKHITNLDKWRVNAWNDIINVDGESPPPHN